MSRLPTFSLFVYFAYFVVLLCMSDCTANDQGLQAAAQTLISVSNCPQILSAGFPFEGCDSTYCDTWRAVRDRLIPIQAVAVGCHRRPRHRHRADRDHRRAGVNSLATPPKKWLRRRRCPLPPAFRVGDRISRRRSIFRLRLHPSPQTSEPDRNCRRPSDRRLVDRHHHQRHRHLGLCPARSSGRRPRSSRLRSRRGRGRNPCQSLSGRH